MPKCVFPPQFFTTNIRESVVNLQSGMPFWRKLFQWTKFPLVPLYGMFPVKMTTWVGDPIYPEDHPGGPDSLRAAAKEAMEELIREHQVGLGDPPTEAGVSLSQACSSRSRSFPGASSAPSPSVSTATWPTWSAPSTAAPTTTTWT